MSHFEAMSHNLVSTSPTPTVPSLLKAPQSYSGNIYSALYNIHELLMIVSCFLSTGDAFHLAQSSRAGFHAAVGQIWYSLRGTRHLFALLPGASFERSGVDEMVITLPDLPTCDFTRFDFYAPLVQNLRWYHSRIEIISDWGTFISFAHSRTLLPNLRSIRLAAGLSSQDYFWFTALASTSLVRITTGRASYKPSSDVEDTSRLFADIVIRCPTLRLLETSYYHKFSDEPVLLMQPGNTLLYQQIASMRNLQSLSMSTTIFQSTALQSIGSLPLLNALEIHGVSPLVLPLPAIDLPRNSFSMLRKLKISSLNAEEFMNVWTIHPLVARLKSVRLVFRAHADYNDLKPLFARLCFRSSYVVELSLRFINQSFDRLSPVVYFSPNFFLSLQLISIKELAIRGVNLPQPSVICGVLALVCPLLYNLQADTWTVSVSELRHFSQLSQLEYLSVGVDWESCLELGPLELKPHYVSERFWQLEWTQDPGVSVGPKLVRATTLFLLSFWPQIGSLTMSKSLTISNYKYSTPWLVNEQLQAEKASRRCGCAICLRRIHAVVPEVSQ